MRRVLSQSEFVELIVDFASEARAQFSVTGTEASVSMRICDDLGHSILVVVAWTPDRCDQIEQAVKAAVVDAPCVGSPPIRM